MDALATTSRFSSRYTTDHFYTFFVTESFLRSNSVTTNCAICMDSFVLDDSVKQLAKCRHYFHPQCIFRWLSSSNTCPICRCTVRLRERNSRRVANEGLMIHQTPLIRSDTIVSFEEVRRPHCLWFCQLIDLFEALFVNKSD